MIRVPRCTLVMLALMAFTQTPSEAADVVSFDRQIQPLLFGRCVKCHGSHDPQGGLQLHEAAGATKKLESGEQAIVPGKPDASELLRRVTSADPDLRMPPKGDALSAAEIAQLRQWIAQGAEWPAHWAYRPIVKPEPPRVESAEMLGWAVNPIDQFILREQAGRGLTPAPLADPRTLIRRVTFDLIGLPPTPEEVAAFVADPSPAAYQKVVERLLASPHFGERQARHWMDLVHFAETHGQDQDRPRENAWPYRDYLIRSFNEDKPFGRFVEEQVAGDVLYPDDPWATVATGFLASGPWDESSLRDIQADSIDRQIARYLDRDDIVTTVLSTFASSTVHCARCHDHKFDPISQREYYSLQAVFAGVDKAERAYDPEPQVAVRRRDLTARLARLPAQRDMLDPALLEAKLQAEVAAWEKNLKGTASPWQVLDPLEFRSAEGVTLTKQADGSLLSGGKRPEKDIYTIVADIDLPQITGVRLEVLTDASLSHQGPGRQDNGNLHLTEFEVSAAPIGGPAAAKAVALAQPKADFDQQSWEITKALDGNLRTAWGIYPQVGKAHRAVFVFKEPLRITGGVRLTFTLKQLHGGGHLIGRPRLSATSVSGALPFESESLPTEVTNILAMPGEKRGDREQIALAAFLLGRQLERDLAALPAPKLVYCGTNRFKAEGSFAPSNGPRPVHLLKRGLITAPAEAAEPAALSFLPDLSAKLILADAGNEGARRAAFARWLSDPKNVLVWRSIVNRVWQSHFGRGLVDSPNDFGRMGMAPTHPELLDWLAATLIEDKGSLKQLHRRIVTSAVYCQASRHDPRQAGVDADNLYLWRMNRRRLDAESIRDTVLAVSGKLDRTMGGPSVKQFIQTPGIHVTPNVDYASFNVDDPANTRRSVYRFLFRTLPDPFMETLDCPDASQLSPKRSESVSALQALAMLNDKFVLRQCEHLAERVRGAGEVPVQIAQVYQLLLGRVPTEKETAAVQAYAARHGLPNACRFLMNTNEFMFVD